MRLAFLPLVAACAGPTHGDYLDSPAPFGAPAVCAGAPSPASGWDHPVASRVVAALGSAHHGSADVVASVSSAAMVTARFTYGITFKDLEDETVLAFIEAGDCVWRPLGEAVTDDDGIATIDIDPRHLEHPGAFNIELVVRGDDSRTRSVLWVVAENTPTVVFDIDGTLTTSDIELADELLTGDSPEMRVGADELVTRYAEAGFLPLYASGRPVYYDTLTRDWLGPRMPPGPVSLTLGYTEGVLEVEDAKTDALTAVSATLDIERAYGNAATDVCAYARAGVAPSSTFIIGDNGGAACDGFAPTVAVIDYPAHLEQLEL